MSRRQWIGLAAVLFGVVMFVGIVSSGTTPDRDGADAAELYQAYWADDSNADAASRGSILLTYATALLVLMSAGLSWLVRRLDDGPLPGVVLAAGAASAGAFAAGSALINGVGIAAAEGGYEAEGSAALLAESIGYYIVTAAMMCAAVMVVAFSLSNRRAGVVPQWTLVLSALVGLAGLGSIFSAWVGFMLLPLWAVVIGGCLLATKESAAVDATSQPAAV